MNKPIRIFSAVWGKYLDWFEKGTVQSFKWPLNNAAIQGATWVILTKKEDAERAVAVVKDTGVHSVEVAVIPDDADPAHAYNSSILWGFIAEMNRCLDLNASCLVAPPDLVFSEGTVANLKTLGASPNSCIHIPHVRVLESFYDDLSKEVMTSRRMVSLAFNKHLHNSWVYSEIGQDPSASHIGGVSWRKLSGNMLAVTHLLPAPFFCNFIPSDVTFFMRQPWFGAIDHLWPSILVKQERERVIGSSDAGFIAEITQAERNVPGLVPACHHDPAGFHGTNGHNSVNKAFVSIFSGE